jgi:hypothetical protein
VDDRSNAISGVPEGTAPSILEGIALRIPEGIAPRIPEGIGAVRFRV